MNKKRLLATVVAVIVLFEGAIKATAMGGVLPEMEYDLLTEGVTATVVSGVAQNVEDISSEVIADLSEQPTEESTNETTDEQKTEPLTEATESDAEEVTEEAVKSEENLEVEDEPIEQFVWDGPVLNAYNGVVEGPSGRETYYNLDMSGVIQIMRDLGYNYQYSVREDGVKMYGPYVMCAANLKIRPKGTIIKTSLGWGIVCDTGGFAKRNPTQIDIAVSW